MLLICQNSGLVSHLQDSYYYISRDCVLISLTDFFLFEVVELETTQEVEEGDEDEEMEEKVMMRRTCEKS